MMTKNILYHNPNCSKSRKTLDLLNNKGIDFEVIEYLNNPPSKSELKNICDKLNLKPIELIRTNEKIFSELGLSKDDNKTDKEWFNIMSNNPILIERPIFISNDKAVIGRPPENALTIL